MTRLTLLSILLFSAIYTTAFEPYHAPEQVRATVSDARYIVPERYRAIFYRYVGETGLPTDIASALIFFESSWKWWRRHENDDGTVDVGLMQLNSAYLEDYRWKYNDGVKINPLDAETNIRVGMRKLAANYRMTGSWWSAVASYNCGLDGFRKGPPMRSILLADRVTGGVTE